MDTRAYIESGILEQYASGTLSIEEMRDVEFRSCLHPEVKVELLKVQETMERFALVHSMAPPSSLKQKILARLEDAQTPDMDTGVHRVPDLKSLKAPRHWMNAAAIALLILASALALYFGSETRNLQQQLREISAREEEWTRHQQNLEKTLQANRDQLAALTHPATVRISMKGTAKSPESLALIYWNAETKEVYLDIKNLPVAASEKQYQLWFINPANQPVSAGVFDSVEGTLLKMNSAPAAAAFAVTLEPKGGSENPTLDEMVVLGTVPS